MNLETINELYYDKGKSVESLNVPRKSIGLSQDSQFVKNSVLLKGLSSMV
jgi:serine phosphatase RsbU (regulator of sigma subunit)